MTTGKKAAHYASKEVKTAKSKTEKTVAGSDLSQAKKKANPRKK